MKKINLLIALVLSVFVFVGCGSHVHEYKETITEPTCTSQGYITYTCTCGDSYIYNYVDEIGHSYGEWKIVKEATTTEEGLKERVCSRCNEKEQEKIEKITELQMNEKIYIDKQVIYNENGIIITANSLEYYNGRVILSLDFENNTEKSLRIVCGTWGYSINSINGWYVYDGYLNIDLEPNEKISEELDFYYLSLYQYGITEIAYIEVGFEINNNDDYSDTVYTGPLKIITSLYNSFDKNKNTYQEIIKNGVFAYMFECNIITSKFEKLYNENNVVMESSVCVSIDGSTIVMLEFKNNKAEEILVTLQNIKINDICVYEDLWDYISLPVGTSNILIFELEDLIDEYEGDKETLSTIKSIKYDIGYSVDGIDIIGHKTITEELPNIKIIIE